MRKRLQAGAVWLCALLLMPIHWAWSESQPAFWRASSESATVYLFGSMHFGHPDFFPLPEHISGAFEQAQVLAVEVDITAISPAKATQAIFKYGQLPSGQSLEQVLSKRIYERLAEHSRDSGVPLSAFSRFQPWFIALQLVEAEIRKTALRQDLGVDLYFIQGSKPPQRIDELETLESQLSLFGGLSMEQQERFLEQTLDDLGQSSEYLNEMASAWQRGDVPKLEALLIDPFAEDEDSATFFHKVFTERNHSMTHAVRTYLEGDETVFFVVGAGHMVGKEGVIGLLEKQGVTVEWVHAPD